MADVISVNVVKRAICPWTKATIKMVVRNAIKVVKKIAGELDVNIISVAEMKILNYQYRGLKKATDVLAFAWKEDKVVKSNFLGEIFLCYQQIKKQSKEFKVVEKEEFSRVLIHGLLHLVGYDHQTMAGAKKMFATQEKILGNIK